MTPAPVPPDGETDAPIPDWEFAGREEDRIRGAQEHAYARGFAAGRAAAHPAGHIYDGSCPDDTQPEARDPNCPACAAAHPDPTLSIDYIENQIRDIVEYVLTDDSPEDPAPESQIAFAKKYADEIARFWASHRDATIHDDPPAASPDERLREAIRAALNELGVPGEGYPAPVANAADILTAALAAADREAPEPRELGDIDTGEGWYET